MHGSTVMLDLGANVLVDAETLTQFAVLGAVFARAHKGIQVPTVGLLNVGSEEMKGPDHVRAAHNILVES
jgi:glycerol-3-phosphate acyltransferase PlsX